MKLLSSISAMLFSGFIYAAPLHNIVIFGDSLSDNGNLYEFMKHQMPQSPPYFEGRFSNGPVWIEHLAASYFSDPKTGLQDYAFGGAGVSENPEDEELFTLKKEVETYLLANHGQANEDSLFIVWIGGNNYLGLPPDPDAVVQEVITGLNHSLQRLIDKGAKHILLINLPDLGHTPAAIEFDAIKEYSYLSQQHNLELDNTLINLKQSYPEVDWMFFDMHQVFNDTIEHPLDYGFTNTTATCYESVIDETAKKSVLNIAAGIQPKAILDACDGYLFFDLVHPTALAHKLLSDKVRVMLDNVGVEIVD